MGNGKGAGIETYLAQREADVRDWYYVAEHKHLRRV